MRCVGSSVCLFKSLIIFHFIQLYSIPECVEYISSISFQFHLGEWWWSPACQFSLDRLQHRRQVCSNLRLVHSPQSLEQSQVWSLTQFLFCSLIDLPGKSMTPYWMVFSLIPSSNSLLSVSDFWADTAPLKGPQNRLVHCLSNHRLKTSKTSFYNGQSP